MKSYTELNIEAMIKNHKKESFYRRNKYSILAGLQGFFIAAFVLSLVGVFA